MERFVPSLVEACQKNGNILIKIEPQYIPLLAADLVRGESVKGIQSSDLSQVLLQNVETLTPFEFQFPTQLALQFAHDLHIGAQVRKRAH
jgi:hypothetical protein